MNMVNNTNRMQFSNVSTENLEDMLWNALDMDELSSEMIYGSLTGGNGVAKGTGHTVNACNVCSSNSNSTHGCGTCC
jgi:hypothetical protein